MNKFFPIFITSAFLLFYSCSGINQIKSNAENSVLSNKFQEDIFRNGPGKFMIPFYGQIKTFYRPDISDTGLIAYSFNYWKGGLDLTAKFDEIKFWRGKKMTTKIL